MRSLHDRREQPHCLGNSPDVHDLEPTATMDRHVEGQASSGDDGYDQNNNPTGSHSVAEPVKSRSRDPSVSSEEQRPPLPLRPNMLNLLDERQAAQSNLQAKATTAVSLTDIESQQIPDAAREVAPGRGLPGTLRARASLSQVASSKGSEAGDSLSIRSSIPNTDVVEVENVFNDFIATEPGAIHQDSTGLLLFPEFRADDVEDDFVSEFEPVGEVDEQGENEGCASSRVEIWILADYHRTDP